MTRQIPLDTRMASFSTRQTILALVIVTLGVVACGSPAWAVVIYPENGEPVMGFLVFQDKSIVKIEQVLPNGTRITRQFNRSDIAEMLITVSPERLEELDVNDPQSYRDYAEELRQSRQDPEAIAAAIRLYIIAAYLDPQEQGRGCLLGLIQLARTKQEERKFRAMAYLLDPKHDDRILQRENPISTASHAGTSKSDEQLLATIRLLRQGNGPAARQALARPEVQAALAEYQTIVSFDDLLKATDDDTITPETLSRLLTLELTLMPSTGRIIRPMATTSSPSWRQAVQRDGLQPMPMLSLETLTEFPPQLCHFRNGKWVRPE